MRGLHSAMEVDMDGDFLDRLTDKLTSFRRLLLPVQVKSSYYHDWDYLHGLAIHQWKEEWAFATVRHAAMF